MIIVEMTNLLRGQELGINHLSLYGHHGQVLKRQELDVLERVLGLAWHHPDQILDTNAKLAILVVSGLVG